MEHFHSFWKIPQSILIKSIPVENRNVVFFVQKYMLRQYASPEAFTIAKSRIEVNFSYKDILLIMLHPLYLFT